MESQPFRGCRNIALLVSSAQPERLTMSPACKAWGVPGRASSRQDLSYHRRGEGKERHWDAYGQEGSHPPKISCACLLRPQGSKQMLNNFSQHWKFSFLVRVSKKPRKAAGVFFWAPTFNLFFFFFRFRFPRFSFASWPTELSRYTIMEELSWFAINIFRVCFFWKSGIWMCYLYYDMRHPPPVNK